MFGMSNRVWALFLLHSLLAYAVGIGWFLADFTSDVPQASWIHEELVVPIGASIIIAFGASSSLALRSKRWREVQLLVLFQLVFYLTTAVGLSIAILLHRAPTALWIAVPTCTGLGGVWAFVYLKHREEVRGPGINLREF